MWQYNNTDELYHYGILGMKWGHRKNIIQRFKQKRKRAIYKKNNLDSNGKKIGRKYTYKRYSQEREESKKEVKKTRIRQVTSIGVNQVGSILRRSAKLTYNNSIGKEVPYSTARYVNSAERVGRALETIGAIGLYGSTVHGVKKQYDINKKYNK